MRHLHRGRDDILEAIPLHLRGGPDNGLFERRGSAEPVANAIAQIRQFVVAVVVGERGRDQFVGGFFVLLSKRTAACL